MIEEDNMHDDGDVYMGEYKPPFTITNKILSYISSISEKIGRITAISNLETKPHLRRNNKMSKDGKSGSGQPFDYQGELVIKYYPVWESHRLSDNESLLSSGGIRR